MLSTEWFTRGVCATAVRLCAARAVHARHPAVPSHRAYCHVCRRLKKTAGHLASVRLT